MQKRVIHTDKVPPARVPLSQGIRAGDWVFASGQLGLDPRTGQLAEGGIRAQTRQVLENLAAGLEAGGPPRAPPGGARAWWPTRAWRSRRSRASRRDATAAARRRTGARRARGRARHAVRRRARAPRPPPGAVAHGHARHRARWRLVLHRPLPDDLRADPELVRAAPLGDDGLRRVRGPPLPDLDVSAGGAVPARPGREPERRARSAGPAA